ncbi:MAG: serine protease [Bacteroidetes bacterium 4572_77]|nr:MAG: serine protease [Bacteroidetes bacterium 4572_77]
MKDYGQILIGEKTGALKPENKFLKDVKKKNNRFLLLFLGFIFITFSVFAQKDKGSENIYQVYQLNIHEEIGPPIWHLTQKAFQEAQEQDFDLILIHMNTYGGLVDAADSIRTTILNSEIPIYVIIDNNAASAGALIAIACDSIYMVSGANIGAATVVNQTGEAMPDKYQSYMRSTMRSTAEATGRDPQIAQAMVDPRIVVSGVSDSGMVITFTPSEAIKNGFCEAQVDGISHIFKRLGIEQYQITEQKIEATDKFIRLLINPMVSSVLIMLIVGGLYFELQSPGIGFPLGAAIIAALLYFAPLYIEGLVENWEILLFLLGVILLAVEIFVVAGFGIFGVSGIVFIIASLSLALVDNVGFSLSLPNIETLTYSLLLVGLSSAAGLILAYYLSKRLFASNSMLHLSLESTQKREEGFGIDEKAYTNMINQQGIAYTNLRPGGKIKFDNKIYDAVSALGFINKGEKVRVIGYENAQLKVMK